MCLQVWWQGLALDSRGPLITFLAWPGLAWPTPPPIGTLGRQSVAVLMSLIAEPKAAQWQEPPEHNVYFWSGEGPAERGPARITSPDLGAWIIGRARAARIDAISHHSEAY